MGRGSFSLLAMGCGYAHNSVPLAMPSAAEQKVENADVGSKAHPLRVSGGVMAGQLLGKEAPRVPNEVLRGHPKGAPVIAIVIDPTGRVVQATVVSGAEALWPYYLDAVRHWTYKPLLVDGKPVFIQTTVTLHLNWGAIP